MALFFSDTAFDINSINFNLPFQAAHSLGSEGPSGGGSSLPPVSIGTESYTLPAFSYSYDEALVVEWGGDRENRLIGNDLSYSTDGSAQIFSGTAVAISAFAGGALNYGFVGFSLSAAEFGSAMHSTSTKDDRAYVTQILAGNDIIVLSASKDVFNSGLGRDLIMDQGGNDRINAGDGNDLVLAGKGSDRVDGSVGNDVLLGQSGDDQIIAGGAADVIWAGVGSDTVTGGNGADMFLFKAGDGFAAIADFNAADDQILFMGPNAGLANLTIVKAGSDVRITFSDVTVLLIGKTMADVSTADIAIGGYAALAAATDAFFAG